MNNEIVEDDDKDEGYFFIEDIPQELADKYSDQMIETKKIAQVFFDDDSNPLWNELYTWEAVALKAGYLVPENYGNRETLSGISHWYLGMKVKRALSRCKKIFSEIKTPIVGEERIYAFPGFDSFRGKRNKRFYGFTTDKTLHAANIKANISNIVKREVDLSKRMNFYEKMGTFNEDQEMKNRIELNYEQGSIMAKLVISKNYLMLEDIAKTL